MNIEDFLARLEGVKRGAREGQYEAKCSGPNHDDRHRSLSIAIGKNGGIVVKCFADCTVAEIAAGAGVDVSDLFSDNGDQAAPARRPEANPLPFPHELERFARALQDDPDALSRAFEAKGWTPAVLGELGIGLVGNRLSIPVRDTEGKLVNHLRYRPDANPKMLAASGHPRTPFYALRADASTDFYVEGEGDGISLAMLGLSVVAAPGASIGPKDGWLEPSRGRRAVVLFDADEAGRNAARRWATAALDVAREVRVIELEGKDGYDVGDLVRDGRDDLDGVRRRVLELAEAAPVFVASEPEPEPELEPGEAGDVERVLAEARVELVELIHGGIPERAYVPGSHGLLLVGKRHLWFAGAKIGKSLAALVQAVDIVDHGGRVALLDRENGADEYARRLRDVLAARGDSELEADVAEGLHYFAYPALKLDHGRDADYLDFFGAFDLVIFDSSRTFLSASGLKEDVSDDYAQFMSALVEPLSRGGVASLILDNAGHEADGRARGSSSKGDLNEVMVQVNVIESFSRIRRGRIRLAIKRSRFAEVTGTFEAPIGGGVYGPFRADDAPLFNRRPDLLEAVVAALGEHGEMGMKKLADHLRERGHSVGRQSAFRAELKEWAEAADSPLIGLGGRGYGLRSQGGPEPGPPLPDPDGGPASGSPPDPVPPRVPKNTCESGGTRDGSPPDPCALGEGGTRGDRSLDRSPPPGGPLQGSENELVEAVKRELDATEIKRPPGSDR